MEHRIITHDNLQAVEITTSKTKMIVVTGVGPRIAFWGRLEGQNLFYWFPNDAGRGDWRLLGGHRVWITRPGADEAEDTYAADNLPCTVDKVGEELVITGGTHQFLNVARGLRITVLDDDTFRVVSFLTNKGPMLYSGGVWAPTCTSPSGGKTYGIPLGDRTKAWDLIKLIIPRRFAGNVCRVDDPQFQLTDDFMIIRPQGNQAKRMLYTPMGVIAMTDPDQNLSFIKQSPYQVDGQYPLGCNLAVFVGNDNFTVELETYGPEKTVQPGETIQNAETWKLVDEVFDWQSVQQITNHLL